MKVDDVIEHLRSIRCRLSVWGSVESQERRDEYDHYHQEAYWFGPNAEGLAFDVREAFLDPILIELDEVEAGHRPPPVVEPEQELPDCEKLAYYALRYAESKSGRQLQAHEAHQFWVDTGFDENDRNTDNAAELEQYDIPSLGTFRSQLSRARRAFNDMRYGDRKGRQGRSVVGQDDLD